MQTDLKRFMADMAAGSPGPWRARGRVHSRKSRVWATEAPPHLPGGVKPGDYIIADVHTQDRRPGFGHANARRISRLPDLERLCVVTSSLVCQLQQHDACHALPEHVRHALKEITKLLEIVDAS